MPISKNIQSNYKINGKNVYKYNKYIIRQKYNLNLSVHFETLKSCLLPPITHLTSQ